jgi:NAD(P)-dependent dehydrogenase (short-subunit alcohol dehydrogenase family)
MCSLLIPMVLAVPWHRQAPYAQLYHSSKRHELHEYTARSPFAEVQQSSNGPAGPPAPDELREPWPLCRVLRDSPGGTESRRSVSVFGISEVKLDAWQHTLAVTLTGPWLLTRAALPGMLERGFGRILYVSSVAALNGGVVGPHYAASQAGLHGLMHHIAARTADHDVTVNTIAPALIRGTRILRPDSNAPDALSMPIPVGRLGTTDEVADLAVAMLRNGYLTNKTITLDGGLLPA